MAENNYQKLGTRTLIYDIFTRCGIPAIVLLLTLALVLVDNSSGPSAFLDMIISWGYWLTLIVFLVVIFFAWVEYAAFSFRLDADIFKIKRGVFTKTEMAIPYRRIESVDIKRNLVHQLFGVSRINIETTIDSEATADSKSNASDEVFPVIDHTLAQTIQEELTQRANVQKMKV
jgi:uncharacterized membrane protein YdbT with pleckstrin-like domain